MSDISPRGAAGASRMIADALLRTLTGCNASFRLTNVNSASDQSELGLQSAALADVGIGPAAMRKLKPSWESDGGAEWELLVSATGVQQQVKALDLESAQALFEMANTVIVSGQAYLIESFTSNEAFGEAYVYRLLLREAKCGNA